MSTMYTPWACMAVTSSLPEERSFLVRHSFTNSGYSIQITDAHTVWTEQLDRRRIIGRALDEDTAIDPSEDATQLSLLLNHLHDTLSAKKSASRLCILDISRGKLHAEAMAPLPRPLKDLKWPFRLSEIPGCTVGTELAAPLISLAYVQTKQEEHLVQILQQKDAAIGKLLEKIEAAGIDLGILFPAAAGNKRHKHAFKREQILQQIHGLWPFEARDWPDAGCEIAFDQAHLGVTIQGAMGGANLPLVQKGTAFLQANFRIRPRQNPFQNDYEGDTTMELDEPAPRQAEFNTANQSRTVPTPDSPPDSDFQRQATPPNLAQKSHSSYSTTPTKRIRQSSTDSPIPTQPPPIPYSSKPVTSSPAIPTSTKTTYSNLDNDDTTDDDDLDAPYAIQTSAPTSIKPSASPRHYPAEVEQATPARARARPATASPSPEIIQQSMPQKTRLGGLGGRRAHTGKQTDGADGQRLTSTDALSPPAKTKLGRLGGAATSRADAMIKDEDDHVHSASAVRGRASVDNDVGPADRARSTSLERADRKREELKRQLAEQEKKAAAAKKKRRF